MDIIIIIIIIQFSYHFIQLQRTLGNGKSLVFMTNFFIETFNWMFQTLQQHNKYIMTMNKNFTIINLYLLQITRTTRTSEKFWKEKKKEVVYRLIPIMRQWEMKDSTKEIIV